MSGVPRTSARTTLGIDLGGTKALAVALRDGHEIWSDERPTGRSLGPQRCMGLVRELVEMSDERAAADSIGVGFPGLVDPRSGRVRSTVILDGWQDVPLAEELTHVTGRPVLVDNDVNAAARAELAIRTTDGQDDFLFVSVGTGIGGALVLEGRVWRGVTGLAGEIGHMRSGGSERRCPCGACGCVNLDASGRSLEESLGVSAAELPRALSSDAGAAVMQRAVQRLGMAIADALHLVDVPLVVVGGGVARHPGYVEALDEAVRALALPEIAAGCSVEAARAGYGAAAVGAALLAGDAPAKHPHQKGVSGGDSVSSSGSRNR